MTTAIRRTITAAILIAAALAVAAITLIHIDYYPSISTYGISAGTSTHYCSADIVSGRLELSCQSGH